jgi:hypothetical protein
MVHVSLDFGQGVLPLSIGILVIGSLFATALLAETLQKDSAASQKSFSFASPLANPFSPVMQSSPYLISI